MKLALKLFLVFVAFFACSLVQTGLVGYFSIAGVAPNLLFILFFLLIFEADPKNYVWGVTVAVIAGFFMDMVSSWYFGISIGALLIICGVHYLLSDLVHESHTATRVFYFLAGCAGFMATYQALVWLLAKLFNIDFAVTLPVIISIPYSLLFAIAGFYIARQFTGKTPPQNQLKLF